MLSDRDLAYKQMIVRTFFIVVIVIINADVRGDLRKTADRYFINAIYIAIIIDKHLVSKLQLPVKIQSNTRIFSYEYKLAENNARAAVENFDCAAGLHGENRAFYISEVKQFEEETSYYRGKLQHIHRKRTH